MANRPGTAPRKVNGIWVTHTGRRLSDAGQTYWENQHRLGLADAKGHYRQPLPSPPSPPSRPLRPSPSRPPDRGAVGTGSGGMNTFNQRNMASMRSTAYDYTNMAWNELRKHYFNPHALMPMVRWGEGRIQYGHPLDRKADRAAALPKFWPGATPNRGNVGMNLSDLQTIAGLSYPLPGRHPSWNRYAAYWNRQTLPSRQNVIDALTHELAHTQQSRALGLYSGNRYKTSAVEGGAEAFASDPAVRNLIARALGFGLPKLPYSIYRQPYGRNFRNRYGRNYALYGQFGQRGSLR